VKNDDLALTLARLARSGTRVTPLASPVVRLTRWLPIALVTSVFVVGLLGMRPDVARQLADGWFLARAGMALSIVMLAGLAALALSVPGAAHARAMRMTAAAGVAGWSLVSIAILMATEAPLQTLHQLASYKWCWLRTLAIGAVPATLLIAMVRHASPLQPRQTASLAVLAGTALGVVGTQFVCPNDTAAHHLVWHAAPVMLFAALGVTLPPHLLARRHGVLTRTPGK
jgi:hypothetical protein